MSNNVFPALPLASISMSVEPRYRTKILESVSGKELRVNWRGSARAVYTLKFNGARTTTSGRGTFTASTGAWVPSPSGNWNEYEVISSFLTTHRGSWDSFLFNPASYGVMHPPTLDMAIYPLIRVRLVEDSIVYTRFLQGHYAIDSLQLIQVL